MRRQLPLLFLSLLLSSGLLQAQATADTAAHATQYIVVEAAGPDNTGLDKAGPEKAGPEKEVKLEVLDFGGTGRPMIFLSGLGATAHDFDTFAPEFTAHYHVYAITRRGFGNSSKPAPTVANYNAERLGDDVLAVIAALKLDRPILVGHSIAGEELSSISSRHPEKAAAFIYLDAALPFAFYSHANSDLTMDMLNVNRQVDALKDGAAMDQSYLQNLLAEVQFLEKDLQDRLKLMAILPPANSGAPPPPGAAILFGQQEFTQLHGPILDIAACPQGFDFIRDNPRLKAALVADVAMRCSAQARALQAAVPTAKVVLLANADHAIYQSNKAEVVREMNSFLATLPQRFPPDFTQPIAHLRH